MAYTLTGCLPLLIGSAKTLRPGEFTAAVAGTGRTSRLPENTEQVGPAAAIVEFRGGLPGDRLEAGVTVQAPWNLAWDLKLQGLRESRFIPAVAAQVHLAVRQPGFGGTLLVTKTWGPFEITGTGGMGRSNERLWRTGHRPFSKLSESYEKNFYAWGGGVEYRLSQRYSVLANVTSWSSRTVAEFPEGDGSPFRVKEGPSYFASFGLRMRWRRTPKSTAAAVVILRGYVLTEVTDDQFEVGRPGVFRATVLLDHLTTITAFGDPMEPEELTRGRAILIHGLPLPQPSRFLARSIELQN